MSLKVRGITIIKIIMIKNLFNISGAKALNKTAQKNIKAGQPVRDSCSSTEGCPPGFCCVGGACFDATPINGTTPPCDPM